MFSYVASYIRGIETFCDFTNFRNFLKMSQVQILCIQLLKSYDKISLLKFFDNFTKLTHGTFEDDHHVVKTVIFDKTKLRNRQGTCLFMSQLSIH